MKQTLQLKLSQHLTLTPQLQQSIRLLQLSTVELNAEVERMLQENPLLEKAEAEDESPPAGAVLAGPTNAQDSDARVERSEDSGAPADRATSSETREESEGVDRSDFEDYSSLPFYVNSTLGIVDSRSDDLRFGRQLGAGREHFVSVDQFIAGLDQKHPAWLVVHDPRQADFIATPLAKIARREIKIGRATLYRVD